MKIAIRYGHLFRGVDTGAEGYVKETDVNRRYGGLVLKKLVETGNEVINVTPPEGSCKTLSESLYYGINMANDIKADLFLSCHVNANVYTNSPMGCEVVYDGKESNMDMAEKLCLEMSGLGFKNRGAKSDSRGLAEIRSTKMPCYIIEPFFVDSKSDVDIYNKVGADGIANAIVKAVTGKSIIATTTTQKVTSKEAITKATTNVTKKTTTTQILKKGDKGEAVKKLQEMLNKQGFNCGVVDGIFGNKTELAVKSFQKRYGLVIDGIVGNITIEKIKKSIN